jgi:hypothetical protein
VAANDNRKVESLAILEKVDCATLAVHSKEKRMIIDKEWRRFWQGYAMGVLSMILLFAAYVSWKF